VLNQHYVYIEHTCRDISSHVWRAFQLLARECEQAAMIMTLMNRQPKNLEAVRVGVCALSRTGKRNCGELSVEINRARVLVCDRV